MGNVSKYGGNNLDGYKDAIQTANRNKTGAAIVGVTSVAVGVTSVATLAIKAIVTLAKSK